MNKSPILKPTSEASKRMVYMKFSGYLPAYIACAIARKEFSKGSIMVADSKEIAEECYPEEFKNGASQS